ncbi:MAG: MFS transporter [Candidatus Arcticimaribacter sp.]|nr:sugar porter family MFS transporter [Flavobacteriaceae bacterium]PSR10596.1 MAG: MFS transporter [Candidatus Arcticimaribacter sp.]
MNKVFKISLISALAGFLFGFDTVVISGADQQLQNLWGTSDLFHGTFVMSMALWGTVLGAIFASYPCNYFGRKNTLIGIGVLYLISALGSGLALDPYTFSFFRFLGGIGVGASTIAAPTYVSEIAPAHKRGQLVALYQFNIVFGILVAFISNFLLKDVGAQPWRWMVGIEALPAILYLLGIITVPKSPRWVLFKMNDLTQAQAIFKEINGKELTESEIAEIQSEQEPANQKPLFSKTYRFPIILAFLIAFFNQLSGINAFLYYAPRIFEAAGLQESAALLSSIGIGVTNLIFTLLGLYLIDKIGRRLLMIIGSIGYIISLSLVSIAFLQGWQGISIPIFLFLFIASHAIGQGAVIWVFISEIFPDSLRAQGQSFGCSVHWVLAALITLFMPVALSAFPNPGYVFILFAGMMVLQLVFVLFMMPETKGISLERLSKLLIK